MRSHLEWLLLFIGVALRTSIYIDGYNLYYGCLRKTPYKWLDLKSLLTKVLQESNEIVKIKYFTAKVTSRPGNPTAPIHQQSYIRALEAYIPEIEVIYGYHLSNTVSMRLAVPNNGQKYVDVIKTEEKGSDVNIALHLLNDAWKDEYDCAVLVSNDSDIAQALMMAKERKKLIGLITPGKKDDRPTSVQLKTHADFVRRINTGALASSQLPDIIPGTKIHKPKDW